MDQLHIGSRVVIMRTENVQHRAPHLIGTKGMVREVPQHPNTWYKILCSDGEVYTLRPTALRLVHQGDEGPDDEAENERFTALAASSMSLKGGKGRGGKGRGGRGKGGKRNVPLHLKLHSGKSGGLSESRDTQHQTTEGGTTDENEFKHQLGTDNTKMVDVTETDGGNSNSAGMELDHSSSVRLPSGRGRSSNVSRRSEGFRDRNNKSSNGSETGAPHDGYDQRGSSSSPNNGERGVKNGGGGGGRRSNVTLAKKKPLTSLDPEEWINQVVAIVGGRLIHSVGKVLRSGNGWVQLLTSSGEVAKRAYELEVVNAGNFDEEWEKQMAIIEDIEKQMLADSSSPISKGGISTRTRNFSNSPVRSLNDWNNRYSQADGGDDDGNNSVASPDDDMDTTDVYNGWDQALNSRTSRLPPRAARRQRFGGSDGKGFGSSLGSRWQTRTNTDSDRGSEPRGLHYSHLSRDRGFGKVRGGGAKDEEHIGDDRNLPPREYPSRGLGKGMGGGKGERKNRRDQASDGSEGGRSLVSPQKAERDRAREAKEKAIERQNARDAMRRHIEQQIGRSKHRPNLSYWLKQLEAAGTDLSTEAEDVDASIELMPLRCSMCLMEKMEGDLFCWNSKCMTSPIFEGYFHSDTTNTSTLGNDGGCEVDKMEEKGDSNNTTKIMSVEEKEDNGGDGGSGSSSGTNNDKVTSSSMSNSTVQERNSFQHRTIIDLAISYALYAPVKWIETRKRKNSGYESFSADPVLYRWQRWASWQGEGNTQALDGIVCRPYPMDSDCSSENTTHHEQQFSSTANDLQKK